MELKDLKELLDLEEEKDNIDIRGIAIKYIKLWKYFAISVVICVLIGGLYTLTLTPQYRVSASILIKGKDGANPLKDQMGFLDNMDILGAKDNVLDEVQVLSSKSMMLKVVNALNLQTTYYIKTRLKEVEIYQTSPIIADMLPENLDTLKAPIEIIIHFSEQGIQLKGTCDQGFMHIQSFERDLKTFPALIETPMGVIRLTRNLNYALSKNDLKIVLRRPLQVASMLQKSMTIDLTDKKANVIGISVPTKNIKNGQDIVNKLIELYNIASVDEKNKTAFNSIKFIDDRLGYITDELTTVEKNVENYKQANKLTDIQAESQQFIKQTGEFEKARLDIETQINLVDFVDQYIHKSENKYGIVPNIGIQDPNLSEVLNGYNEILFKRDRLIRTTTETNPIIIDIERQIKSMRKAIEASVESTRRGLMISKHDMDKQDVSLTSKIKAVPRQEREFIEIKRQQEIKAALYTYLLQKREENSLTLAIGIPTARVIEEPLADDKLVSKGKGFYLSIAFILGLIFPVIFFFFKDFLRARVRNRNELEGLTTVTILGELPEYKGKDPIVVRPGSNEPIAEMYRLLRANLQFILHDHTKKVINVTSSESGEGKTTFALNLAMALALTGKKVILVGLDIRKPALGEYINLQHSPGITAFLSGIETNYKKIIQPTSLSENLSIIVSGTIPPNPNELLLKESLDELFVSLRNEYDYIITDSSPVGLVSDTLLIDRLSDVTLYIVRANYTHKHDIRLINDIHKKNKLKNMYIVLKGSDIVPKPYGYSKKPYGIK
ncbi:MAG: polysaccharide biosynthesis tyrosine autokinase [Bacteroidales bacterium]|nr:polysaccharide biosynthesis tyrosine autokinase [Bacteroidales bacterium]